MRRHNIAIRLGGSQEQVLISGRGRLLFVSWKETSGSAASEAELFDGNGIGGQQCLDVVIPTSSTANISVGSHGVLYYTGLFLHVPVGSVSGTVTVQDDFSDAQWEELLAAGVTP